MQHYVKDKIVVSIRCNLLIKRKDYATSKLYQINLRNLKRKLIKVRIILATSHADSAAILYFQMLDIGNQCVVIP